MTGSASGSRLRQVGVDREVPDPASASAVQTPRRDDAALALLLTALKTLSQRTVVALGQLAAVFALFSVWWLFNNALPADPSVHQLIGLGLYGALVLAVLWVKR